MKIAMVHVWHLACFGGQFVPGVKHLNWGLSPMSLSRRLKIQQPQVKQTLLSTGGHLLASHSLTMSSTTNWGSALGLRQPVPSGNSLHPYIHLHATSRTQAVLGDALRYGSLASNVSHLKWLI